MPQSGRIQRANRNGRGLGNTAADIASDLVGLAGRVYLSPRYGNYVVSLALFPSLFGSTFLMRTVRTLVQGQASGHVLQSPCRNHPL